jgi:hypothetical protein
MSRSLLISWPQVESCRGYAASAEDDAKTTAARRWIQAVNNWGELGHWEYELVFDPKKTSRDFEKPKSLILCRPTMPKDNQRPLRIPETAGKHRQFPKNTDSHIPTNWRKFI